MNWTFFIYLFVHSTVYLLLITGCNSLTGKEVVKRFFKYFEASPPKGIPIFDAGEPLELNYPILAVPLTVSNGKLYGHSELIIDTAVVEFVRFRGEFSCHVPTLRLTGNYVWNDVLDSSSGDLDGHVNKLKAKFNFTMDMTENDVLHVTDLEQKLEIEDVLELNMTGLNWLHQFLYDSGALQLFFHQIADEVLRQNKPYLLEELNSQLDDFSASLPHIRSRITDGVRHSFQLPGTSPKRRSLVLFFRRVLQYAGIEPFRPPVIRTSIVGIKVKLFDLVIKGTSNINDIPTFKVMYSRGKIFIHLEIMFPHILTTFQTEFRIIFFTEKSKHLVNMHGVKVDLKLAIDPSLTYPVTSSEFECQTEWIGNIGRYSKSGRFRDIINKIEKSLQGQLVKLMVKTMQPVVKEMLRKINLQKSLLNFFDD